MENQPKTQGGYTPKQLENVMLMVDTLKAIRQELINEGIPVEEYEKLFISGNAE